MSELIIALIIVVLSAGAYHHETQRFHNKTPDQLEQMADELEF